MPTIEKTSHRLKGAAGMIGATARANVCDHLETTAQKGDTDTMPGLRNQFADAAKRVKIELDRLQIYAS